MASVWIRTRETKSGGKRFRVEYRPGGREKRARFAGSFKTKRLATIRAAFVEAELAVGRLPVLPTDIEHEKPPTLEQAAETWRATRIDVEEQTRKMHRSDLSRVFRLVPALRSRRVDEITAEDIADVVAKLAAKPYKRETISKSKDALAMVFDYCAIAPNPARDKRVKLPKERKPHIPPPLAEHVERIAERVPRHHVLPLLNVDECGPRVTELATAEVGDLDEHRKAIRVRWTVEKNDRYRLLELPDDLFEALLATLPPREDRDLAARLFPDLTDARLRTAISKACAATGTPHFSPHGLRRRRGSLYYKRTGSLVQVAELLGDSKRVAAEHYVYALTDYREVDRTIALARVRPAPRDV